MVARSLILGGAFLFALPAPADAAKTAGRVVSVRGEVTCRLSEGGSEPVTRGYQVEAGDTLVTGEIASVRIVMSDKSILALGPNTEVRLAAYGRERRSRRFSARLRLGAGRIWARVSKWLGADQRRFEVETANAVAGVRGTEFVVHIDERGNTNVWVVEGEVEMGNADDELGTGGDGRVVGASQRGSVGNDGQVQVADVPPEQVIEQVGSVGSGPGDGGDGEEGAGRDDTGAGEGDHGREGVDEDFEDEEGDEADTDEEVPEIDLDPGSGNARVRGRIEVRD